jgi:8-oxo-dGTP pyrophosphatase MutT (NUDIX family)
MHWTFPGGGVQRNETTDNAVKREVAEEVGIRIKKTIYLGEYYSNKEYKRDTVSCYLSSVANSEFTTDKSEIQEAGWFSINDLPRPASPAVERVLDLYRKKFN